MAVSRLSGHPEIGYMPDYDSYLARGKRRQETETLDKNVPEGFPSQLNGSLVWDPRSLANTYDWNYHLTAEELDEINNALRHFKYTSAALNKPMGELSPVTFPLPKLHRALREISHEVHNGHGFKVLRGLPVDNYTREENVIIYAGLSSHVAPIRGRQDSKWQGKPADILVAHVKDLSQGRDSQDIPGPVVTADKQVFHTDAGDIIALFCLSEGESGGESFLASTCHVYNVLAARRPDLIRTLSEPWPFDDFAPTGDVYKLRPLLYYQPATETDPERLIIQYSRRNLTGYRDCKRSAKIPPLTEAQAEALDAVHFTAEENSISLDFHKGDIQFANNLSILHARAAFTDSIEKQPSQLSKWRPFKRRLTRSLGGQADGTSRAQSSYVREDSTIRSREDDAASVPSNASVSTATAIPFVQYPNPGYLGSFSHTTLFDQLPPQNNAEPGAESQQSEDGRSAPNKCVIDDICINKGAELILGLHREFSIRSFAHLFQKWVSTGANLALAGPLTGSCASAVDYTLSQCDGKYPTARAISKRLFHNSCQPILSNPETTLSEYCTFFSGANARWEAFGIFFVAICRASVDIPYAEPLYDSEQPRRRLQRLALSYSDQCLELCLPLDCMNDLQLLLQYENFISHSQVDGDQSYLSWRKLGDVAASLYALGYHQQQTESFRTAPSFLRDLRQTAFCRTYSADKNVSIFLGRPPRILRKFCYFHLPGTLAQPNQKACRTPAVWDPSEKPSFVTDSKWAAVCGILKEDILDLFAEESYEERARQGHLIDADARAQWDAIPESYRLQGSLKTCNRPPVERDFMVNMKLNYLHVHFLLRRALLRPMSMGPAPELFNISKDMLGLVVETILLKDQIVNSGTSLVWKVVYYGLSAAGLVSLHLANQSYANEMLEMDISKIFQDLSILVGEISARPNDFAFADLAKDGDHIWESIRGAARLRTYGNFERWRLGSMSVFFQYPTSLVIV
ncbi:hypothetical protein BDV33DRAFT_186908 [Aspergillus novoparasiticus]|uniref:TauD/TfdA-like domain-containing protein n=1 Tax=Aspergillus novoparasiticus TaxID=986946 RepID=A0A5N6FBN9_9EURO|nr:hypothetical protein BDV33DRAFT_186908 [Aspergillus novoparasiticus]